MTSCDNLHLETVKQWGQAAGNPAALPHMDLVILSSI